MCDETNFFAEFNFGIELIVASWLIPSKSVSIEYHGGASLQPDETLPLKVQAFDMGKQIHRLLTTFDIQN